MGNTLINTLERRSKSLTGGRSGLKVISISATSLMSASISKCLNSDIFFFLFFMSSIIIGVKNRLFPIIKGHNVFLLAGGSPCFQSDSRTLLEIVNPVVFDF
jgi:hypothetical protein